MTSLAHIEYWPPEPSRAELAAVRWLTGYRHGTVNRAALAGYYAGNAQAAGRMWRALVAKLLVDPERRALTPAALNAVRA